MPLEVRLLRVLVSYHEGQVSTVRVYLEFPAVRHLAHDQAIFDSQFAILRLTRVDQMLPQLLHSPSIAIQRDY